MVDAYSMADTARQFIGSHPQLSGYIALMTSLVLTGRLKIVLLGSVLGLAVLYAYRVSTACAAGHLPPYHVLIALFVSVAAITVTAKYAFR